MFAFPLSVCFWFLYIANMLLIYFCLAAALFGCSSSFCSLTITPVQNLGACLGLSEVLTFSSPLQLLTALLLHWIKVSDLLCNALTRNISWIPAWKAARVPPIHARKLKRLQTGKKIKSFITVYQPPSSIWAPKLTRFMILHIVSH